MELVKELNSRLALGLSLIRSTVFTGEKLALPLIEKLATGKNTAPPPIQNAENFRKAIEAIYELLKKDSENISQGFYPKEVLKTESLLDHALRFQKILLDGYAIAKRRKQKKHKEFNAEAQEYMDEVPEYFQRNFHFQTGGYLTKKSADLYEHQVEILFSGAGDAMRRLVIPMIKKQIPGDGEGLKFLELGAGTGRLTKFMAMAYPKAKIVALDLSHPYLQKARENLKDFSRIDFIQGLAEELPFQKGSFDFVFSCFVFHELPLAIREQVIAEAHRVLKPHGYFGFVDSIQNKEAAHLGWALQQFPVDFHEPFYKNYVENDMAEMLERGKFKLSAEDKGFLSKSLLAQKI
jgi:ubiquinone/menaquinone biosynthesis C-methylase UbiE